MKQNVLMVLALGMTGVVFGATPLVTVTKTGAERVTVSLNVSGNPAYAKSLAKNLELSGYFRVGPDGSIKVTGQAGGTVTATGKGKQMTVSEGFADDKSARMAARRFSDKIVANFTDGGKGYATTRIAFVNRKGSDNSELYMCYPDGQDIRQLTSDGRAVVGPRWAPNGSKLYYIGYLQQIPDVYHVNVETGARGTLTAKPFIGGAKGVSVSPDGRRCAIILSHQGNPELYVIDLATGVAQRMTKTPNAAESSPCWSPDGRRIAYVTDLTRQPQVYICDVASRKSTRFTNQGKQNTHPDWSEDGKLAWTSLQGGQWKVRVASVAGGEASARDVTAAGTWQDPSWAADGRHLVAARDNTLFIVDTDPEGDKPVRLLYNKGHWMNPAFSR